jgi:hypothetical protein
MSNRFVLDASLLKKYSSDTPCSGNSVSLDAVCLRSINGCGRGNVIKEVKSFMDLLDRVKERKAIIYFDDKINEEYRKYIDKIPSEIRDSIWGILSDSRCSQKTNKGKFLFNDFQEIENTTLKDKGKYLHIAKALPNKRIVSTEDDKLDIYTVNPNDNILFRHNVFCKCTWEYLEEVNSGF